MLKVHQIRNATVVIEWNDQFILVDPMLSPKGKLPSLKYLTMKRVRNPLVELPSQFDLLKPKITAALITHCQKAHFDHLDGVGYAFLRNSEMTTYCSTRDGTFLTQRKLKAQAINDREVTPFLGGEIETVPALHGRGIMKVLMEHGRGYFIRFPGEPTLYLMGDTVLTPEIEDFVKKNQPDFIVAPAGSARFDFGEEILMKPSELKTLARMSDGIILANHLDALDHCRQTRAGLNRYISEHALGDKIKVMDDGEEVILNTKANQTHQQ